ncbi:hypothetical protein Poli38472_006674 [Pythium oligandrum]|uniref:Uncharacterized protein n=1 Tax=Pythium oligandrum TaxID=41045 RepID=A0A8K1C503_PYTOL|nr:hypothetical protein Poli38472_006674 [Pythium oligandrum]|eukprot:TMW56664.1 hypothetical protein Poli38472_006674 [Pythium oligandrum]
MKFAAVAFVLAAVCASEVAAFGCKPEEIVAWRAACDKITTGSQAKCNDRACHTALHRLVEEETIECHVSKGGSASDLAPYKVLDDFCHGDGPDPELTPSPTPTPAPQPTPTPGPVPTPSPEPTQPGPVPTPSPQPTQPGPVPTVSPTPHPSC